MTPVRWGIEIAAIDTVYNPLPNPLHVPLRLAAVRAGKHVLCEKPFAVHAAELHELRPFATKVHIRAGDIDSLRFSRQLAFTVGTQCVRYQRLQLVGTTGWTEIKLPFNPPEAAPVRYGAQPTGSTQLRLVELPAADQYQLQCEAFSRAVREETPDAAGLDDAAMNLRVIEAVFASAKSGRFESV